MAQSRYHLHTLGREVGVFTHLDPWGLTAPQRNMEPERRRAVVYKGLFLRFLVWQSVAIRAVRAFLGPQGEDSIGLHDVMTCLYLPYRDPRSHKIGAIYHILL